MMKHPKKRERKKNQNFFSYFFRWRQNKGQEASLPQGIEKYDGHLSKIYSIENVFLAE